MMPKENCCLNLICYVSYPGSNIPDYTVHTELTTLEKSYTDTVRRLSLDSSVESYKTYLVYGFMG